MIDGMDTAGKVQDTGEGKPQVSVKSSRARRLLHNRNKWRSKIGAELLLKARNMVVEGHTVAEASRACQIPMSVLSRASAADGWTKLRLVHRETADAEAFNWPEERERYRVRAYRTITRLLDQIDALGADQVLRAVPVFDVADKVARRALGIGEGDGKQILVLSAATQVVSQGA